jgi:hypothetical protein
VDFLLDDVFMESVRRSAECGIQRQQAHEQVLGANSTSRERKRRIKVVAHYRRGDADNHAQHASLITHVEWYFEIFAGLKRVYPEAQFEALTSCYGPEQCNKLRHSETNLWRDHGIELRVDDELSDKATEDWKRSFAHMLQADIFIMARSSFSHAAALFNPNCVIHNPADTKHPSRSGWVEVSEPLPTHEDPAWTQHYVDSFTGQTLTRVDREAYSKYHGY